MGKKMRTTTHHGRANSKGKVYSSKHNDRNFDVEKAPHIDMDQMVFNSYWHCYSDDEELQNLTHEEAELRYYEEHFGAQLKAINDRYIKNGHPERCKTMEQWKQVRQNAPEETIYQIGNHLECVSATTLIECYYDFLVFQEKWSEENGKLFEVLNNALHLDEPNCPPHYQTRRVWFYEDKETGMKKIGQEKALKAAGIELPFPDKPEGRYNNRKMTFDKIMRDKWIEICLSHGIDIETVPVPGRKRSLDLDDHIRKENERLQAENKKLEGMIKDKNLALKDYDEYIALADDVSEQLDSLEDVLKNQLPEAKKMFKTEAVTSWLTAMSKFIHDCLRFIHKTINRLRNFEESFEVEDPRSEGLQKRADSLDSMISGAEARTQKVAPEEREREI